MTLQRRGQSSHFVWDINRHFMFDFRRRGQTVAEKTFVVCTIRAPWDRRGSRAGNFEKYIYRTERIEILFIKNNALVLCFIFHKWWLILHYGSSPHQIISSAIIISLKQYIIYCACYQKVVECVWSFVVTRTRG